MSTVPVNTTESAFGQPLIHPAWDKFARWALHSKPIFGQFVSVQEAMPTNNGLVYYLPKHSYLSVNESRHVLDEVASGDQREAEPTEYVRIVVQEQGEAIGRTKLSADGTYVPIDPIIARQGIQHMVDTLDETAADAMYDGSQFVTDGHVKEVDGFSVTDVERPFTQVVGADTSGGIDWSPTRSAITKDNLLTSNVSAAVVAKLRGASAEPLRGSLYVGIAHPDVMVDYQNDVGAAVQWNEPHKYVDTSALYVGETGAYRGTIWLEHPRARVLEGAGAGTPAVNVYQTLIFGREVLGRVVKTAPGTGLSPVLDTYNRHRTFYWYSTLGFGVFRQEPLWRIETGSSLDLS